MVVFGQINKLLILGVAIAAGQSLLAADGSGFAQAFQRKIAPVVVVDEKTPGADWFGKSQFVCHSHGESFSSQYKLRMHFKAKHDVELNHDQANTRFKVPVFMKKINDGRFVCQICNPSLSDSLPLDKGVFINRLGLISHMSDHRLVIPRVCQDCGVKVNSRATWYRSHAGKCRSGRADAVDSVSDRGTKRPAPVVQYDDSDAEIDISN